MVTEVDPRGVGFDEMSVGSSFVTRGRTITEADLVQFGTLTGDMHPAHIDETSPEAEQFGGRIAHGMLLVSYAVGLVDFDPRWIVALRSIDSMVFKRPAHLGDTIQVEGTLGAKQAVDDARGLVTFAVRIISSEKTLVRGRMAAVWRVRRLDVT